MVNNYEKITIRLNLLLRHIKKKKKNDKNEINFVIVNCDWKNRRTTCTTHILVKLWLTC